MNWIKAYRIFNKPPKEYLLKFVLPILGLGIFMSFAAVRLLSDLNMTIAVMVAVTLPLFSFWIAFQLPRIQADAQRRQIDDNIHFFITHMGVLATANLPPVDILTKLGDKKEYGALAEASVQMSSLVRSWNMGLPEAVRFVSERTPSTIFADFLERLAYALETGEDLLMFLKSEQEVVIGDYATVYQANLYGVDSVKDMFMSTIMSVIFLIILVLISPILTGTELGMGAWGIAAGIGVIEGVFLLLLLSRVPNDDLWTKSKERVGLRKHLDTYLPLTLAVCFLTGIVAARSSDLAGPWILAIAVTPLMGLGYVVSRHESRIERKDDNFPAFIRSLGASTSARGGSPKEVLKRLRRHDFGPLTNDVDALYRRLNLRLADDKAWNRFANEAGSNIIEKFTSMFIEGINSGGIAEEIGLIVSDNVVRIIGLRKHRVQTAGSFRGMLLGLTGGMSATLYLGVGLLDTLKTIFEDAAIDTNAASAAAVGVSTGTVDIGMMHVMVMTIMVLHTIIASYMVTTASGGSRYRMTAYIPVFAWINAVAAWATLNALSNVAF